MKEDEKQFFKCSECGNLFDSEELLKDHFNVKHPNSKYAGPAVEETGLKDYLSKVKPHLNLSFGIGLVLGVLLTTAIFGGAAAWNSFIGPQPVDVTVVTCEECNYERFQNATDRMFNANYKQVNYQTDEGQEFVERYNLEYVPGFILEKSVGNHENFTQIRPNVISMENGYVLDIEAAQRFSDGEELN